jgi:hypothetical protein
MTSAIQAVVWDDPLEDNSGRLLAFDVELNHGLLHEQAASETPEPTGPCAHDPTVHDPFQEATMATTSAAPGRTVAQTDAQRLSTETKGSTKTSELYVFIAVVVGILIAAAVIKGGDSTGAGNGGGGDEFIARQAWLYVSIVTAGYLVSRGLAKSGSREPYTTDSDNH